MSPPDVNPAAEGAPILTLPSDAMIVVPVRNTVMFPEIVFPITLSRPSTIAAAQQAVREQRQILVVLQHDACALHPQSLGQQPAKLPGGPLDKANIGQIGDPRFIHLHRHARDRQRAVGLRLNHEDGAPCPAVLARAGSKAGLRGQTDQAVGRLSAAQIDAAGQAGGHAGETRDEQPGFQRPPHGYPPDFWPIDFWPLGAQPAHG